ncbi:MAG: SRPBCC domain-containing protein [Ignavibacteriae bacterium]|nr:SRPBCC domain-containing protein [Ignavibacteriota bacterium]
MAYAIKQLFHINAPREKVYEAISTIDGLSNWWSTNTTGDAGKDGIIQFHFGEHGGPQMKVTNLKQNENVTWECVSTEGWDGHIFTFDLDENDGKTRVRFSHSIAKGKTDGSGILAR